MILDVLWILLGLGFLTGGGETLVKGSVALALHHRIKPAVIGLTVVAAGTSMPELVTSLLANLRGIPDVAVGNVIGSNIFNVGLVLGLSALVLALPVEKKTLKLEWPFLFLMTLLSVGLMANGILGRIEGLVMVMALVVFLWVMVRLSRAEMKTDGEVPDVENQPALPTAWKLVVIGLVLLPLGGWFVVEGASGIARGLGISERVIGLTIVAMGTSLPELASSLAAAVRGRTDLAVGNIIGSNLFNLLAILGMTSLVRPLPVNEAFFQSDVWWMVGFTVILIPVMYFGRRVTRTDGVVLLIPFVLYMILLIGPQVK